MGVPAAVMIGLNVAGGLMRARAARQAAAAQAAQDEFNARLAESAAGDAQLRGQVEEGNIERVTSERVSSGKAQFGASGVDVQSGSALDALSGLRTRGKLAAMVVRSNAAREAWGYSAQAANFHARAAYALQAGDQNLLAQLIGTGSSTVGQLQSSGVPGVTSPGVPGVTSPVIRVGEPTVVEPWMTGNPLGSYDAGGT